jgi:uncharacterized protein YjbI with pentapeptide repeats
LTYTSDGSAITITDCDMTASGVLDIPDKIDGLPVSLIGDDAFAECTSLTSITIPDGVTSIGSFAFWGCTSLTSITIGSGVTSIGNFTFWGCYAFVYHASEDDLNYLISRDGQSAYLVENSAASGHVTIPEYVNGASVIAFTGFDGNDLVTSITIGSGVTSIGGRAFERCTSLERINIYGDVTSIGDQAFTECTSLTSITIPDSVTSIGFNTFYQCTSLTSITIGSGVTSIGDQAFAFCSSLTSIDILGGVTSIGSDAFWGCTSLTSITIPDSVTGIYSRAFSGCSSLNAIRFEGDAPTFGSSVFDGIPHHAVILVNDATAFIIAASDYPTTRYWVGPGADLSYADLSGADLSGVRSGNITGTPVVLPSDWSLISGYLMGPGVDLTDADLTDADLTGANLTDADLSGVRSGNITGTPVALPSDWSLFSGYLIGPGADLTGADLSGLNLTDADLTGANLSGVRSGNITGTPVALPSDWSLISGYLIGPGADLTGADLTEAILSGTDLTDADFTDANLTDVTWGAGSLGSVLAAAQADLAAAEAELASKYSLDEIIDLRPGSVMIAVEGGSATMTLQLQTSTDLNDWQDAGDPAEVSLPTDDASVRFYRFNH